MSLVIIFAVCIALHKYLEALNYRMSRDPTKYSIRLMKRLAKYRLALQLLTDKLADIVNWLIFSNMIVDRGATF